MVYPPSVLVISAAIFTLADAAQNGSTLNEISSTQHLGWVSQPSSRSTSGIIWSCVSVLLVCSYKCIHLNIPSFEEQQAKWYEWPAIRRQGKKLVWMVVTLLAPEVIVMYAIDQLLYTRYSVKLAEKIAPHFKWSYVHGFYAMMGGFACFDTTAMTLAECKDLLDGQPTLTKEKLYSLTLEAYATLLTKPTSSPSEFVTARSIEDRSKSDLFTKLFAIAQCTWLVVGLIGRASAGLPSSQLELGTAAYVLCAITIYSFWWHKPFNVNHVTIVSISANDSVELIHQFDLQKWKSPSLADEFSEKCGICESFECLSFSIPAITVTMSITAITAISFSAFHLVAWNWEFPSPVSSLLWRVFAITAAILPLLYIVTPCLEDYMELDPDIGNWILVMIVLPYCIARLCLIALMIYSLTSMPAEVYQSVAWVETWPHFL